MLTADFPDTIYAIQHVAFEDLGAWEDVLYQHGFRVRYVEAGVEDLTRALQHPGLTIILGGPIGVGDVADFPFLAQEIELLTQRLAQNLPTLGICLGAQLIAHALGAKVYRGAVKEIGWSTLALSAVQGQPLSALEHIPVLHWHGDSFELPAQAEHLASSTLYSNQAFRVGNHILALQFHAEVAPEGLEKWLIGHQAELRQAEIDIPALRAAHQQYAPALVDASAQLFSQFLKQLIQA